MKLSLSKRSGCAAGLAVLIALAACAALAPAAQAASSAPAVAPRKPIPYDPRQFDKFVGYYEVTPLSFAHVYRKADRYFAQITGQPPVEWFPESQNEFFSVMVPAEISFTADSQGRITGLVVHDHGQVISAARVSEAAARKGEAALEKRVDQNMPSPGTRTRVLGYIQALERGGEPDYGGMTPEVAAAARAQLPKIRALLHEQGEFRSLAFGRVAPNGWDLYIATFTRGRLLWLIAPLTADGKVPGLFVRPMPVRPTPPVRPTH